MRYQFLIVSFFICFELKAQITFNHRLSFDLPAAILTSVIPTDSCYYATGIIADTVPPYSTGNIFVKFDLEGVPEYFKILTNPQKTYETWFDDLIALPDGGFAVQGFSVKGTVKTILIRYNQYGDTLFTREYPNPFYPTYQFIQPRGGFCVTPDGGFVICNSIRTSDSPPNVDTYLIKTDSLGNVLWIKNYSNNMWDRAQSMLVKPDGSIIIGAIRTNDNTATSNYTYLCHIFQVDSLGTLEWDYLSQTTGANGGLRDAANEMVLLEDGSLVVASGVGTEIDWPSVNQVNFDKQVFKLNANHELEWSIALKDPVINSSTNLNNIIAMSDNSGFIAAGTTYEPLPTLDTYTVRGWVGKITPDGDSVWARQYYFYEAGYAHEIVDLKKTSEGGMIMCGQSRNITGTEIIPQQAWLFKLDQYGCLIPGCHLPSPTQEPGKPEISLAIYPNPTTDYLNFQLRASQPAGNGTFRIVNSAGGIVKQFEEAAGDATYIVPVWEWANGAYFLQYLHDGEVRHTKQFIKN